ncbi:hypothetical protein QQS21_011246 [Conoideocrella luteorostrata]|uniref:SnoaL-like domain-containing protein n=1 Tax=Conoideocrella luteorostrata TaxID=1105319 RepID=A0AAJ0CDS6_9HYPO|nr:hypothetical protein QQS21_011246 [Conoideocrella luteorostrata]
MDNGSKRSIQRRAAPEIETPTNQNNVTHWTVDQNKRQMQVTDDAFVARDLARFNHHPDIKVYQGGVVRNLTEHLTDIQLVYATTDLTLHNHDYKIWFGEGDWTVAVESVTGIQNGPLTSLSGGYLPPSNKPIGYDLMTIARWNNGWMMEEYLWSDNPLMYRQVGVLPVPPPKSPPGLELNLATPLSTTSGNETNSSSVNNKAAASRADDALNNGTFTLQSLNLAPDALIYGLTDLPLDAQGYINWLQSMKTAFPDLRLQNKPYEKIIGQGDWTATAAFLSGTHRGELVLPRYISPNPILATGRSFDMLHYTIARWQNGKIVGLRVYLDLFTMIGALGISL